MASTIRWVDSLPGHATYRWAERGVVEINQPKWFRMTEAMRGWYRTDILNTKYERT
jgi:hypothetical protein